MKKMSNVSSKGIARLTEKLHVHQDVANQRFWQKLLDMDKVLLRTSMLEEINTREIKQVLTLLENK